MDIGEVVELLKNGRQLARKGWNGKGMYIALHHPTGDEKMTTAFVYMKTAQGEMIPWLCSQSDLLADDWEEV